MRGNELRSGTPFEHLGLAPDADERAVRKAYATRLRGTRPEDDPEGFQRLHEAYRAAMEAVSRRERKTHGSDGAPQAPHEVDAEHPGTRAEAEALAAPSKTLGPMQSHVDEQVADRPGTPIPPTDPAQEAETSSSGQGAQGEAPEQPVAGSATVEAMDASPSGLFMDLGVVTQQILDRGGVGAEDFEEWLRRHPDLFRLDHKATVRALIVEALLEGVALSPHGGKVLARFFDLGRVDSESPLLAARVETAFGRAESASDAEFIAEQWRSSRSLLDRELVEPPRWLRRCLLALVPREPSSMRRRIEKMEALDPSAVDVHLDASAMHFWLRATDRSRLAVPRLLIVFTRLAILLLGFGAAFGREVLEPRVILSWCALVSAWLIGDALLLLVRRTVPLLRNVDNPHLITTGSALAAMLLLPFEEASSLAATASILSGGLSRSAPPTKLFALLMTAAVGFLANVILHLPDYQLLCVGSLAMPVVDTVLCWRYGISSAEARERSPFWMLMITSATFVAAMILR